MISIQKQVSEKYQTLENKTLDAMKKEFPNTNPDTIKTCFYRARKVSNKIETNETNATINMEMVEGLLMKQLKKKPDVSVLRLMVDFLKIKSQDHSELEEIDLSIFMKKAMED